MNRVPGRNADIARQAAARAMTADGRTSSATIDPGFRNLISHVSNCARFRDFREFSST